MVAPPRLIARLTPAAHRTQVLRRVFVGRGAGSRVLGSREALPVLA